MSPALRSAGRIGVSLIVLAALVWQAGAAPFAAGLAAVTPLTVAAAAALTAAATAAAAWRWRVVAVRLGVPVRPATALAAYYRSQFLNSVLPGGVVGDVDRALAHGRRSGHPADATRAVVAERVAGQLVQLAAGVAVIAALGLRISAPSGTVLLIAATVAVGAAGALAASRRARKAARREVALFASAFRDPATTVRAAAASVVVLGAHTATFTVACLAVGVHVGASALIALGLVTVVAGSLPVSVGGWGTREAVAAWAFASAGLDPAQGIAASTAFGVLATIAVLPGIAVIAATALRSRRTAPRPAARASHDVRTPRREPA